MNKILLVSLIMFLMLTSCKLLFQAPIVNQIQDLKLTSFSPDHIEVKVSLLVSNPNRYSLAVEKLSLNLLDKNRIRIGFAQIDQGVQIPGKKETTIALTARIDTRQAVKIVSHSDQKILIFIEGNGVGRARGFSKSFTFEEKYSLDIRKYIQELLPKFSADGQDLFRVLNTSIDSITIGETTIKINFMLLNPYGLSFSLKNFPSELYINEKMVGRGYLQNTLQFDENVFYRDGAMIFKLNNLKSITGAAKGVLKGEISYNVTGKVQLQTMGIEFERPYQFKSSFPVSISNVLFGN